MSTERSLTHTLFTFFSVLLARAMPWFNASSKLFGLIAMISETRATDMANLLCVDAGILRGDCSVRPVAGRDNVPAAARYDDRFVEGGNDRAAFAIQFHLETLRSGRRHSRVVPAGCRRRRNIGRPHLVRLRHPVPAVDG